MASLQNYNLCDHSVGVDPVPVLRHLDIHPGDVGGTPDAPGDQAHHCPSARLGLKRGITNVMIKLCRAAYLTHKGGAAIADTGVLANLATGAHLARMKHKPVEEIDNTLNLKSNHYIMVFF